jgi:signal transduction histidine kinase
MTHVEDVEARLEARTHELAECEGRLVASEQRAEAETRLKDAFLAAASHELRTPLNAIVGWVHILRQGTLTADHRDHAVEAIERNARALTKLIEELLDVSRMVRGQLSLTRVAIDLRTTAGEALEAVMPAAAEHGITVELDLTPYSVVIEADPDRVRQVAWNLWSNAVKFTPKGGNVRVHVDRAGGFARLCVEDTGEGIDPALLPHVFEAFRQGPSTAMRSGLGLGLALVRHLVELHGGTVTADSPGPGHGAVFVATFPLANDHLLAPGGSQHGRAAEP